MGDVVGIDIGGTKIAGAVVSVDGSLLRRGLRPTSAGAVLEAVVDLVAELTDDLEALGVAAPGVIDPEAGSVASATGTLPDWAGTGVRAELERRLGVPVAVDNDVFAMALGEAQVGAGRAFPDALYVAVGTGIGGAIYRQGALMRGPHHSAGAFAHILIPPPGRGSWAACGCGAGDHLEGAAAGPGMAARYLAATGSKLELAEIAERARGGDRLAAEVIEEAGTALGRGLAGLLAAVDADAVVIGGGVAQVGGRYLEPVAVGLRAAALPQIREIPLLPAALGTAAPLVGAALLTRGQVSR